MHSIFRYSRVRVLSGMAMTLLTQGAAFATVIKVYDPSGGADFAALKEAARLVEVTETSIGTIDGFRYEIAEGPLVPARFSKTGGAATYIWSSHTLQFESGFDFRAGPFAFGKKPAPKLDKEGAVPAQPVIAWKTAFGNARLTSTGLRLEYDLAKSEAITAALFDARGKTVASWTWREANAGRHVKAFAVNRRVASGPMFLRLKAGDVRMVRKVRVE